MANTLFGAKLDSLHPANMLRTEARAHLAARQLADAQAVLPPTNDEILQAVKGLYHAHSDAVDANTLSGLQYAKSSDGRPRVAALNAYNWKSQQAAPVRPTAEQVYTAPLMKPGVEAATTKPDIWTRYMGSILPYDEFNKRTRAFLNLKDAKQRPIWSEFAAFSPASWPNNVFYD